MMLQTVTVPMTPTITAGPTAHSTKAIEVRFISKGRHSANLAFYATGRNRETGTMTIGVGLRKRRNALIEVSFDLWRIGFDLSPETVNRLEQQWLFLCAPLPRTIRRKIGYATFGRCFNTFNVPIGQAEDWREFLTLLLGNPASYTRIAPVPKVHK